MKAETPVTVTLRAIEPEDLDLLYQIENDQQLWQVGATNVPYSRYTLHDYIATSSDDIYADRQVRLIIENADHQTVGICDIVRFEPQHMRAEAGIVVMKPYRQQGYAKAALSLCVKYLFKDLLLHQVYCSIDETNTESQQLFVGQGFELCLLLCG